LNKLANRVAGELKSFQADILHAHPGAGARLGAFRAHVPVVSTYHTIGNIRSWIPKAWDRYLARGTDALVAISGAARDYWAKRLATDGFEVIHNGIDLTAFPGLPERLEAKRRLGWEGRLVLFIGRLNREKAVDLLLNAWAIVSANAGWKLMIVGSGAAEPELRKLADDLGISSNTIFIGETMEPYLMMRAADIVVVPSRVAAFELVVVEAMAAGTPVIVSDADALPEVAGDAALTFRNEDANELADKLSQIMHSDAMATELMGKGLQRAANFSLDRMVDGYEQLFQKIAGK
jgi:glycosyltransferase involved in cell wall biosynthesis